MLPESEIFKKFNMTDKEEKFFNQKFKNLPEANRHNFFTSLFLSKTIENSTDKTIESNNKLAEANSKYAKELNNTTDKLARATWILVIATGGLFFIELIKIIFNIIKYLNNYGINI